MKFRIVTTCASVLTFGALAACGSMSGSAPAYSQAALPAAVQFPAGNAVAPEAVGVGSITYQCRAKKDAAG